MGLIIITHIGDCPTLVLYFRSNVPLLELILYVKRFPVVKPVTYKYSPLGSKLNARGTGSTIV
ncbi:MAG: hypothetical protein CM1200mP37_8620 [Chloroflexota bacterium]|nr:MAG: hypothetical protein CM1200mP37_8620 [Chloroflexota bacterium]